MIAAVRLARDDVSSPSPRNYAAVADSVNLARKIPQRILGDERGWTLNLLSSLRYRPAVPATSMNFAEVSFEFQSTGYAGRIELELYLFCTAGCRMIQSLD